MKPSKVVIGLTGNIASGKSTVTKHLIKKGFYVIDADIISREVVARGTEGLKRIIESFGEGVISVDGTLNRKELGSIVFSDKRKLEKLNRVLHPIIRRRIIRTIEKAQERVVFIDAALIFELELDKLLDMVWMVKIRDEIQLERLMKRDGSSKREALDRIQSQVNQDEKVKKSDIIIYNDDTKDTLYEQVDHVILDLGLDKA
jgi:dephospho-CoA kinase